MIHINELKQDYFHFVENHLALVGERTGLTFKIGQKVRVKVVKADPDERAVDFELVSAEEVTALERPKHEMENQENAKENKQENAQKEMARRTNDIAIVSKRSVRKGRSHFTKVLKEEKKNKMSWRKQLCQKARKINCTKQESSP